MKISDFRSDSWNTLTYTIKEGGRPRVDDLAAALLRGETVPPEAQRYIAGLLNKSLWKPGRPPKVGAAAKALAAHRKQLNRSFRHLSIMEEVHEHTQGKAGRTADQLEATFEKIAKARNRTPETIRRYYREALAFIAASAARDRADLSGRK